MNRNTPSSDFHDNLDYFEVSFFDEAPVGQVLIRLDGSIVRANRMFQTWISNDESTNATTRFQKILSPGSLVFWETHILPLLAMQEFVFEVAIELTRSNGAPIPVLLSGHRLRGNPASVADIYLCCMPTVGRHHFEKELIEEKQRAENISNQLREANKDLTTRTSELAAVNKEMNEVLGMVAHDLRSPLSGMQSLIELLAEELQDSISAEHLDCLQLIAEEAKFMFSVANQLLSFSRIDAGKLELKVEPVDIDVFLGKVVRRNQLLAQRKSTTISLLPLEHSATGLLDCDKITQCLDNLIGNAIKFSPPGSHVTVETAVIELGTVIISVVDSGPGIPKEEIGRLFQPFQSTSVKPTGDEPSTGLGLTISRKVVECHGGKIWVESEVGKGSAFRISLPLTP
jgi:signal transduction histidine kinase